MARRPIDRMERISQRSGNEVVGNLLFPILNFERVVSAPGPKPDRSVESQVFNYSREVPATKEGESNRPQLISLRVLACLSSQKSDIGTYLKWVNPPKRVGNSMRASVSFYAVNRDGERVMAKPVFYGEFTHKQPSWGHNDTFSKDDVVAAKDQMLVDGCFTIGCQFRITCNLPQQVSSLPKEKYERIIEAKRKKLGKYLTILREGEELTDVILVCQGEEIPCHKWWLAQMCSGPCSCSNAWKKDILALFTLKTLTQ